MQKINFELIIYFLLEIQCFYCEKKSAFEAKVWGGQPFKNYVSMYFLDLKIPVSNYF